MLNDADGHGGGQASEALKDTEALFRRLASPDHCRTKKLWRLRTNRPAPLPSKLTYS
jgi:hypothetical protein